MICAVGGGLTPGDPPRERPLVGQRAARIPAVGEPTQGVRIDNAISREIACALRAPIKSVHLDLILRVTSPSIRVHRSAGRRAVWPPSIARARAMDTRATGREVHDRLFCDYQPGKTYEYEDWVGRCRRSYRNSATPEVCWEARGRSAAPPERPSTPRSCRTCHQNYSCSAWQTTV